QSYNFCVNKFCDVCIIVRIIVVSDRGNESTHKEIYPPNVFKWMSFSQLKNCT
ncbi:hypothetical protein M5D96_012263, partial [Drosophila gunungcola]